MWLNFGSKGYDRHTIFSKLINNIIINSLNEEKKPKNRMQYSFHDFRGGLDYIFEFELNIPYQSFFHTPNQIIHSKFSHSFTFQIKSFSFKIYPSIRTSSSTFTARQGLYLSDCPSFSFKYVHPNASPYVNMMCASLLISSLLKGALKLLH